MVKILLLMKSGCFLNSIEIFVGRKDKSKFLVETLSGTFEFNPAAITDQHADCGANGLMCACVGNKFEHVSQLRKLSKHF